MTFSLKEYRDAFAEAYRYGMERAGPVSRKTFDEMLGKVNEAEGLRKALMKAVVDYIVQCYGVEVDK